MRDIIAREEFSNSVHTELKLKIDEANSLDLELAAFQDLGSTPRQEQFSLEFRGPLQPILPQAIYQMEHPSIGAFHIFLVPVRRDNVGTYYEAVFNRFAEQQS